MREKMFKTTSFKRLMSTLLIAVMVLTMLPVNAANAADNSATYGKSVSFNGADGKTVSVNIVPAKVKFDVKNLAAFAGKTGVTYKFVGDKATVKGMKKIASISKKGILKGKKDGVVTVGLYDSKKKDANLVAQETFSVAKLSLLKKKDISTKFIAGEVINAYDLVGTSTVSGNTISQNALLGLLIGSEDFTVTFKEKESKVGTVSENGIVVVNKGGKSGSIKVQMTVADKNDAKKKVKLSTTIKVKLPKLSKKSIKLNSAKADKTKTLKVKNIVNPDAQTATWVSSDVKIATVKDGVVTPVAAGETTVSAVINGTAYSCKVTVK